MNKKQLSIILSKLKPADELNVKLEQYQTEGELAGEIIWKAFLNNDINEKIIADLGCGNGILGIAALLLGAKKVYFLDIDKHSIKTAMENYTKLKLKNGFFLNSDVKNFNKKIDTIIMNPPFGVQKEHSDRVFLEKAMLAGNVIYSLHKIESKNFINSFSKKLGFRVENIYKYKFLLKQSYKFHKSKSLYVDVGLWIIRKL
ncbi:methyltransferase [Candidatus Woesearchaeota archaeon]|nr:methyltransferase [Candidatus Woesearchaeota archaeon]